MSSSSSADGAGEDALMTALLRWRESQGAQPETETLRRILVNRLKSEETEPEDRLKPVCDFNVHAAFMGFYPTCSDLLNNVRLLRDATASKRAQSNALQSGVFTLALRVLKDSPDIAMKKAALGLVANSSSAVEAADVLSTCMDQWPNWFEVIPEATAMLIWNTLGLHGREVPSQDWPCIAWMCRVASNSSGDTHFWLDGALKTLPATSQPALLNCDPHVLEELIRGDYLLATDCNEEHVLLGLTLRLHGPAESAIARWTAQNDASFSTASKIITVAVATLKLPVVDAISAERTSNWLQIIANLLSRSGLEVKREFHHRGGVPLLLNNTYLDARFPTKREWAIMAIAAACKDNPETQQLIASLQPYAKAEDAGVRVTPE